MGKQTIGITSYGAYVPFYRLDRKEIATTWGRSALPGEKAVANCDEDSITMSVAAVLDCLGSADPGVVMDCILPPPPRPIRKSSQQLW